MNNIRYYLFILLSIAAGYWVNKMIETHLKPQIVYPAGSSTNVLICHENDFLKGTNDRDYSFTAIYGYYDRLVQSKPEALVYDIIAANKYNLSLGYPKAYDIISEIENSMSFPEDKYTILLLHKIAMDFLIRGCKKNKGGCEGIIYGRYVEGEDFYDPYLDSIVINYK